MVLAVRLMRSRSLMVWVTPFLNSWRPVINAARVGAHVGLTSGGLIGAEETLSLGDACDAVRRMYDAAVTARADVLVVAHGGPFEDPASVGAVLERTSVHGYLGASSIERLPVERAVADVVRAFKALPLSAAP